MSDTDYARKVQQQVDQYITEPIHDLPDIFHVWSHEFICPAFIDVFGIGSINDFYLGAARETSADFARPVEILSVGCGDGSVEIELAKSLRDDCRAPFKLIGADLSPVLIDRFQAAVQDNGLGEFVFPLVKDLNAVSAEDSFDVVMANHSLHHIVELERVVDYIWQVLKPNGILATSDMIGRNGHMRWPETEAVLQAIWPLLTKKQRFHHQLLVANDERFVDFDASGEGFEGIRAQDILPLLLERFFPYKFVGYGGFIDVLVDRGYGHGFDAENDQDREFIRSWSKINDMMLDANMIKPTIMTAYFTKDDRGEKAYRNRTARRSIRNPDENPGWIAS